MNPNLWDKKIRIFCIITVVLSPLFTLIPASKNYATTPTKAIVDSIRSNRGNIWVRGTGRPTPARPNSTLKRHHNSLLVRGDFRTYAFLRFFAGMKNLNLFIQANGRSQSSIYYFPCRLRGGFEFGWGLESNRARGCERGMQLIGGRPPRATLPTIKLPAIAKPFEPMLIAQFSSRPIYYCTVNSSSGKSWLAIKMGEPCSEIMQECSSQSKSSSCEIKTSGNWQVNEPDLTAVIECSRNQVFKEKESGSNIKAVATELWEKAISQGATSCVLQVYAPNDLIVEPASDDEVIAAGNNPFLSGVDDARILISSNSTDACSEIKVINGAAIIKSAQYPQGKLVRLGNKSTTNFCQIPETEPIDLEAETRSLPIEIATAHLQNFPFCDEEQSSGGQEGDRRTIQLTKTEGILEIEYQMYSIPDRLQIFYEGNELYDSDFVKNSRNFSLPFQGNSGRLEVILTGNKDKPGTRWNYKISCPS